MTKLKGLILTEGMHGMISQAEGLAKALGLNFFHEKIELNNFWKLMPSKFTPVKRFIFKNSIKENFDVIISCGRKSVIPSIFFKQNSQKKIFNIHIQDPKVSLKNFDFVVAPEHDDLEGENVISTKGALHYLNMKEIDENRGYLEDKINKNKDIITLILGGPTKYYKYTKENIQKIYSKLNNNINKKNLHLVVIPSMRTPSETIKLAKEYFGSDHLIIDNVDKKAYLSGLSLAKFIVVMCDSSSMISEAALTGKPIYVAQIPSSKNDYRFKKFRDLFKELNIIKELNDNLETWNYERLDETNRVAQEIKKKLF
jgi:mitochondrial fission protein ELM1